jgi:hypothetical protein
MYNYPFTFLNVTANYNTGHFIEWQLDHLFADDEPHEFIVEVSEDPKFSEITYSLPKVTNTFFAVDDTKTKQAATVDFFYRIKLKTPNKLYYSNAISLAAGLETRRNYVLAAEIVRKELLRLGKYTGHAVYLLKRKNYGKKVKESLDPISGIVITNNVSDFGTSFEGGYFRPLKTLMSYEAVKQDRKLSDQGFGTVESSAIRARMAGFPIANPEDIIVDAGDSTRYRIMDQQVKRLPGTSLCISQIITIETIATSDIVYKIPLDNYVTLPI